MAQPFQLCPDLDGLHAKERLNYVLGQVLGVKDFQQEQKYFLYKSQLQNRGLHGYGTVWGLDVTTGPTDKEDVEGIEVKVSPGLAIDPLGREVAIEALQCANLTDWLAAVAPKGAMPPREGESPRTNLDTLAGSENQRSLYVTLCYRTCETGAQPILANPCRTDSGKEGAIQYTRTRDDFELQLRAEPPNQNEEDRVRAIANLFSKVKIISDAETTQAEIEEQVDALRTYIEFPYGTEIDSVDLPQSLAQDILKDLLRYWVTKVRPTVSFSQDPLLYLFDKIEVDPSATADDAELQASIKQFKSLLDNFVNENNIEASESIENVQLTEAEAVKLQRALIEYWSSKANTKSSLEDDCLLLGSIEFSLNDGAVDNGSFTVENSQRPYLLHTRLLQELILTAKPSEQTSGGTVTVSVGSVTTGEPGTEAKVEKSGTDQDVVLDFVIPRGQPGGAVSSPVSASVKQHILRPADFLMGGDGLSETDAKNIFPQIDGVGKLSTTGLNRIGAYPALLFKDNQGFAVFSTLWSNAQKQVPQLRLYYSYDLGKREEGEERELSPNPVNKMTWNVSWRWRRSIESPLTVGFDSWLNTQNFSPRKIEGVGLLDRHLHKSEFLIPLTVDEDFSGSGPDYLVVYLSPSVEENIETGKLYLLMAELTTGDTNE